MIEAELEYVSEHAALSPHTGDLRLCSLYAGGDEALVVDVMKTGLEPLRSLDDATLVIHNAPFDLAFLEHNGIFPAEVHDTMQMARLLLGPGKTAGEAHYSLARAANALCGIRLDKKLQASDWSKDSLGREHIAYAAQDVVAAWRIAEIAQLLDAQASTESYEIQIGAICATTRMTLRGVGFDVERHAALIDDWRKEQAAATQDFIDACRAASNDDALRPLADAGVLPKARHTQETLNAVLTEDEIAAWPRTPTGMFFDRTRGFAPRRTPPRHRGTRPQCARAAASDHVRRDLSAAHRA